MQRIVVFSPITIRAFVLVLLTELTLTPFVQAQPQPGDHEEPRTDSRRP
jgi:hypothetical protein